MDKNELAELCQNYKKRLINECGISVYESKHISVHYFLDDAYGNINKEISVMLLELNKKEFLPTLQEFSNYLYSQGNILHNSQSKYSKKCSNQYLRLYNLVSAHIHQLQNSQEITVIETPLKTIKTPKESDYNKPDLNTKQILAVMKLLQGNGIFNKDLTDKAMAESFGMLTGYSGDQLRKNLAEFKKDEILFEPKEIQKLKDIMVKIGKELDKLPLK